MTNIAKKQLAHDAPGFLREMYDRVRQNILGQLELTKSISHDGERGSVGEELWIGVLRQYLPKRFNVRSGIVIDSQGRTSDQIDIIIHDLHHTPTLLGQGSYAYIPAEAVYAVFEVKQRIGKDELVYTADKLASVRTLHRTSTKMIASGKEQSARRLFPIVGGILASDASWQDGLGETFLTHLADAAQCRKQRIDCGCALRSGCFDLFEDIDDVLTKTTSSSVGETVPDHAPFRSFEKQRVRCVDQPTTALIVFLFRLLHILNRLGTVPAVDWNSYAKIFSPDSSD